MFLALLGFVMIAIAFSLILTFNTQETSLEKATTAPIIFLDKTVESIRREN